MEAELRKKFGMLFAKYDKEDLMEIYHIWKEAYSLKTAEECLDLRSLLGQKVTFRAKHGRILSGVLKRVNQKTVTIHVEDGTRIVRWRVSPSYVLPA